MDQQTNDLIKNEIENNEVCLFMKGTPDAPQCGFSMATSNILFVGGCDIVKEMFETGELAKLFESKGVNFKSKT